MKTPRVTDFDPNAKNKPSLKSSLDNMPAIVKSKDVTSVKNQDFQNSGIPENQKYEKRDLYDKATYRLCDEAIDAVADAKKELKRKYKLKVNLEEIVETAILHAYSDLIENGEKSLLVSKYSGKPENQNS